MCMSSSPKTPDPIQAQARPAVIARVEDTAPRLAVSKKSNAGKVKRGKGAFKQKTNVTGINTPGTGSSGLSIFT